ncbi:hypothetical protein ASPACDRAFT_43922 [Aspergillus aculeatus ATCC 16872]|uniref:Uncharacterized protein n=1 Tax=Aspergillus aculeatus (strain ATCC 16872 / CBS 172.66 / WB 5094) TaxID=690307 RepID=A0A1L9WSS0_ASPA1|nr:uncharacterized protein ASPACDRAFT_43922 [Aspergillus aculeatus ATCC 16872]OJJ99256.1 hypothetical protein ASPACDRAFT_43922 [Aspergillus aculeatus ATCC 16872]
MADWFNLEVWQRIVLQISHAEPAAYHAAVALSALHEDVEMRGLCRAGKQGMHDSHHRFAFEQYGKAMVMLRRRLASNDPQVRLVALICCITFICVELLHGSYKSASVHLRRGAQLVEQRDGYWRHHPRQGSLPTAQLRYGSATEAALVQAFMVLDVQVAQYEQSDALTLEQSTDQNAYPSVTSSHGSLMHEQSTDQDISLTGSSSLGSNAFGSLLDARQRIKILMSKLSQFRGSCETLLHDNAKEPAVVQRATAQQDIMLAQLSEFAVSFEELVARRDSGSLTEEERRNIALLRLQHLSLLKLVDISLAASEVIPDRTLSE